MKLEIKLTRHVGRVLSGALLLTGITVPLVSGSSAALASSSLPAYGTLYVVNHSGDSVTVISPGGSVAATIPLPSGSKPTTISVSQDDTTAWVADSGTGQISEINLETNTVANNFSLPSGENPISATISPASGYLDVVESGTIDQVVGYSIPDFTVQGTYTPASGSSDTAIAQSGDGSGFSLIEKDGSGAFHVEFLDPNAFTGSPSTTNLGNFSNYYLAHGTADYNSYVAEAGSSSSELVCVTSGSGCPTTLSSPVSLPFTPTAVASSRDGNTIVVLGVKNTSGQSPVNQFDLITGIESGPLNQAVVTFGGSSAESVTFSNDGTKFFIGDASTSSVSQWTISNGSATQSAITNGVADPSSIAPTYDVVPTPTFVTTLAAPGGSVTFDATNSPQPTSQIVSYKWDFGDGSTPVTTTSPVTSHVFANPGQHTVTLTITDAAGTSNPPVAQVVGFLDPSRHALAYVTDTAASAVSVVDTQSNPISVIGAIPLVSDTVACPPSRNGDCPLPNPVGIAASPDFSTVYVAANENESQGVVDVISTSTNQVTGAIPIAANPSQIAVSADGTHLFVLTSNPNAIDTVDLTQNPPQVSQTLLSQDAFVSDIAISPDGTHLGVVATTGGYYPGQYGTGQGVVWEFSVANDSLTTATPLSTINIASAAPSSLVMSNSSVYVAPSAYNTTTGLYSFSSFDISSGSANFTANLTSAGDQPDWISLSPDGKTLQMTVNGTNSSYVAVRDASNGGLIKDVTGTNSTNLVGIAYTPDGSATISVDLSNNSVVDVDPYNVVGTVSLDNIGPNIGSTDPNYVVVGQAPAPVVVTTSTTAPTSTTTTVTPVSQPSSPPTTSVSQPSSTTQSTLIVPTVNTGKPWSSNIWWALVSMVGLIGVVLLRSGSRRRIVKSNEGYTE